MNDKSTKDFLCVECGAKLSPYEKNDYIYCPVCTSRISMNDVRKANISIDLISSLNGEEIDKILINTTNLDTNKAKVASDRGSVFASIFLGSYYYNEDEHKEAKKYFMKAAQKGVPDGTLGRCICQLDEVIEKADPDLSEQVRGLIDEAKSIDKKSLKYLSKSMIEGFYELIDRVEKVLEEFEKPKTTQTSYSDNYSSGYSGYYESEQPLSTSELRELNSKITYGLWNPSAIDSSDLTESQKQQLKDYNRIYGD